MKKWKSREIIKNMIFSICVISFPLSCTRGRTWIKISLLDAGEKIFDFSDPMRLQSRSPRASEWTYLKNLGLGLSLSYYRCDADESSRDSHESNPMTSAYGSREIKDKYCLDPPTTYHSLFFSFFFSSVYTFPASPPSRAGEVLRLRRWWQLIACNSARKNP